ncbi:hypothetical protein J1N35_045026 [Gossypium stocksii]|uniref:Large ribosomal subunit protein uL18 C-terminal eukaryotes domain-containing protein n=1 Tax=Gossypium stocksii TaxID=47602 RepID=A0A9D3UAB3_9ROSI|nr:hypothetical protein J1N35_045026 [Gossypium stocksii]
MLACIGVYCIHAPYDEALMLKNKSLEVEPYLNGHSIYRVEYVLKKVHAAIPADPTAKKTEKEPPKQHKRFNLKKLTYEERKAELIERLHTLNAAAGADSKEED